MLEKVPVGLKLTLLATILLIAPAMVLSLVFGGMQAAMIVLLGFFVFLMAVYIVGVRKYM